MQPIKDYIVLDFLEWLRRRKNEYLFIDRLDYDEEYEYKMEDYAKEYFNDIKRISWGLCIRRYKAYRAGTDIKGNT